MAKFLSENGTCVLWYCSFDSSVASQKYMARKWLRQLRTRRQRNLQCKARPSTSSSYMDGNVIWDWWRTAMKITIVVWSLVTVSLVGANRLAKNRVMLIWTTSWWWYLAPLIQWEPCSILQLRNRPLVNQNTKYTYGIHFSYTQLSPEQFSRHNVLWDRNECVACRLENLCLWHIHIFNTWVFVTVLCLCSDIITCTGIAKLQRIVGILNT